MDFKGYFGDSKDRCRVDVVLAAEFQFQNLIYFGIRQWQAVILFQDIIFGKNAKKNTKY